MDDSQEKFFKPANIVTQAGEYLLDHGFGREFVYKTSQAFLALTMTESRIVRACREKAWEIVMPYFNEYGQEMILKGIKYSEEHNFKDKDFIEIAEKYKTHVSVFGNIWCDKLFSSLLTYSAIGYMNTESVKSIEEVNKEMNQLYYENLELNQGE
ncbi:hypothetical protein [Burkholderia cepacia]|uniref:hypothetical protein n=1 Tax=Burkholderia cepacia TaxID=292 RepID=UPI00158D45C9|nr:hypothetical protein [Burkholderia cepacia]